jgi:hypothetical protein
MLVIPPGWSLVPPPTATKLVFAGPGGSPQLLANSLPMTVTLDELVEKMIAGIKSGNGVDPEKNEPITMAGVPGRLLAYHFTKEGVSEYQIDAFCVSDGRGYELSYLNRAGSEDADMALFLAVLAKFQFRSGF